MTIGFVILAHQRLDRVGQLTRWLVDQNAPVSIHVDIRCPAGEFKSLQDNFVDDAVYFEKRSKCNWGSFDIVKATERATAKLLQNNQEVSHVMLLSGSCLPTGPIANLRMFLEKNDSADLIEAVPAGSDKWVKTGLNQERFEHYFPLGIWGFRGGHQKLSKIQSNLGIKRKMPNGLEAHLGSQWWCLSRKTLEAILNSPRRAEFTSFFKQVLIPDESYFQSLARYFSDNLISQSPTLAVFNAKGQPFNLYDDHLDLIQKSDRFFVRKVWPNADGLYSALLGSDIQNSERNNTLQKHLEEVASGAFHASDVINSGRLPRD